MIDVPWNGFCPSKRVGELAQTFQMNIAPHNYYSHLSSFISASLCAVLPNVRIMEIDIDDVPWKDEMVTNPPEIIDGYMTIPSGPAGVSKLWRRCCTRIRWDRRLNSLRMHSTFTLGCERPRRRCALARPARGSDDRACPGRSKCKSLHRA